MTKEQLIDIFARFILENSAGDKYFYPNNVEFRGHKVFSIHYTKLYDDYEIHTEAELNPEKKKWMKIISIISKIYLFLK